MVNELRIYFEGDSKLRSGFNEFFSTIRDAARDTRCPFHLIAAGGTPIEDFNDALSTHRDAWNVLVLDSDRAADCSLEELCRAKAIDPRYRDRIFWMVQIMESWFLADVDCLKQYYGSDFNKTAVAGNPRVEDVPKRDVLDRLKGATKATKPGEYHKTKHAPQILATLNPTIVRTAAPNCERLFRILDAKLSEP